MEAAVAAAAAAAAAAAVVVMAAAAAGGGSVIGSRCRWWRSRSGVAWRQLGSFSTLYTHLRSLALVKPNDRRISSCRSSSVIESSRAARGADGEGGGTGQLPASGDANGAALDAVGLLPTLMSSGVGAVFFFGAGVGAGVFLPKPLAIMRVLGRRPWLRRRGMTVDRVNEVPLQLARSATRAHSCWLRMLSMRGGTDGSFARGRLSRLVCKRV